SLFDRFPKIEASVILEITRHELRPMDLYKLDPSAQDKNLERRANLEFEGGQLTAVPHTGSLKDFPNLSSVVEPMLLYFDILTTYAATCRGDMAATLAIARGSYFYISHLSALNRQYLWPAVLAYHKDFFLVRRREMANGIYSGWLTRDAELMSEHLFGQSRPQSQSS
ncbi:hypothetical protein BDZ97DRAFT_1643273, partial [Flammula alnicola]